MSWEEPVSRLCKFFSLFSPFFGQVRTIRRCFEFVRDFQFSEEQCPLPPFSFSCIVPTPVLVSLTQHVSLRRPGQHSGFTKISATYMSRIRFLSTSPTLAFNTQNNDNWTTTDATKICTKKTQVDLKDSVLVVCCKQNFHVLWAVSELHNEIHGKMKENTQFGQPFSFHHNFSKFSFSKQNFYQIRGDILSCQEQHVLHWTGA